MRKYYLDNIRWICVVLVVLFHVIYVYNNIDGTAVIGSTNPCQIQDGFLYLVYPWFMSLLFIVAGMSARYVLEHCNVKTFLKRRTEKLLVPSTIGLLLFGWLQGYINMAIAHASETLPPELPKVIRYLITVIAGTGVLWFIQVLWIFSVVLVVVRKIEKGKFYAFTEKANVPILLLLGILYDLSGFLLNTPMIAVYRFGIYGFSFFTGYFVLAHEKVIACLEKAAIPLMASAGILAIIHVFSHFGEPYATMPQVNSLTACAYGWVMCLAMLGGIKRFGDRSWAITDYMRKRSFGLYIFHYLPLSAVAYFFRLHGLGGTFIGYVGTGIAGFVGGFLLYECISKIPILRWCALGIRKEKDVSR